MYIIKLVDHLKKGYYLAKLCNMLSDIMQSLFLRTTQFLLDLSSLQNIEIRRSDIPMIATITRYTVDCSTAAIMSSKHQETFVIQLAYGNTQSGNGNTSTFFAVENLER